MTLSQWIGSRGESYVDFAWRAATDTSAFKNFRRSREILPFFEHVSVELGRYYFALLKNRDIIEICANSAFADTVGNPQTFDFAGKMLSPTTMRYAKVTQDLATMFPNFSTASRVIEIGVGYGGQARLISEYMRRVHGRVTDYHLVDLFPVNQLARLYLDHFHLHFQMHYATKSELSRRENYDFVISNYAFSEFKKELQQEYLDLIISKSSSGYLTMNSGLHGGGAWRSDDGKCFTVEELMQILPRATIVREQPLTSLSNYILVFGQHAITRTVTLDEIRRGPPAAN